MEVRQVDLYTSRTLNFNLSDASSRTKPLAPVRLPA